MNDNKTLRYCLYIGLLACLVAVGVGQVQAWYLADRDGTQRGEVTGEVSVTLDSIHIYKYYGTLIGYDTAFPTTEWSVYGYEGRNYWVFVRVCDVEKSAIYQVAFAKGLNLYKCIREYRDSAYHYDRYVAGSYVGTGTAAGTTPYYAYFSEDMNDPAPMYIYFMTVGDATETEYNLVLTHPSTYFIAKDFINPAFSGLYSSLDNAVWADRFYARYISDTPAKNITIKNKATGTTIYSHATTGVCGLYQFNITEIFFDSGVPYGIYTVAMDGSTQSQDIPYMGITTTGTNCNWDDTEYVDGDTATIGYNIGEAYWMTDDYTYELRIEDTDFDELDSWSIITRPVSAEREVTVSTSLFPTSGYYYCGLYAIDKSSGEEILMCYDYAYMYLAGSGEVIVEGETYDATTGNLLGSCVVTATQLGGDTSDTSDATDATYQITGLVTDSSIGVNATKTDYIGYPIYFTPYEGGHYEVDVPLVPSGGASPGEWQEVTGGQLTQINHNNTTTTYYNLTEDGTAIGGLVYEAPYWGLSSGCNVTVGNSSWSDSNTTGDGGWYQINDIPAGGNYWVNYTKTGFQSINETVTITALSFNRQDAYLNGDFTLTVSIKDMDTNTIITDEVYVELDSGDSTTTETGSCTFSGLDYGSYTITTTSPEYYPGSTFVVVDGTTTATVYMQAKTDIGGSGPSSNYPPHMVRFSFVDAWGNPIDGATVTATATESSTPWSWLTGVFGFDTTAVDIQNETLTGTTGNDGTISFLMVETVRYSVNCVQEDDGIDHTITMFPKESEYFIRIGTLPLATDYPEYDITAYSVNDSYVRLSVNYTDAADATTSATFYVNDINGTELYNTSISLTGGSGSATYDVENVRGTSVEAKLVAENTAHGTITASRGVDLKGTGKLVDFGWPDLWYILISFAGILIVAGSIGEMDTKVGAMFVPITAGMFWYIGWLPGIATAVITMVFFVGGIYYMRASITKVDS